MAEPLQDH